MIIFRWATLLAVFIFGFILGAAVLNYISGTHLDRAELEIQKLNHIRLDQTEQIKALENNLAEQKAITVNTIEIRIISEKESKTDPYNKLEIEKEIKQLLKNVRGQEISTLDPLLINNMIDKRTVTVSEHRYILSVKGTLISEKLVMYVEVQEPIPSKQVNGSTS